MGAECHFYWVKEDKVQDALKNVNALNDSALADEPNFESVEGEVLSIAESCLNVTSPLMAGDYFFVLDKNSVNTMIEKTAILLKEATDAVVIENLGAMEGIVKRFYNNIDNNYVSEFYWLLEQIASIIRRLDDARGLIGLNRGYSLICEVAY